MFRRENFQARISFETRFPCPAGNLLNCMRFLEALEQRRSNLRIEVIMALDNDVSASQRRSDLRVEQIELRPVAIHKDESSTLHQFFEIRRIAPSAQMDSGLKVVQ